MFLKNKWVYIWVIIIIVFLLVAWDPQPGTTTLSPTQTEYPNPTQTATNQPPKPTKTKPTATKSPATPISPTPSQDLSETIVYSVADFGNGQFMIVLDYLPQDLLEQFTVTVDDLEFTCESKEDYPQRLFCLGAGLSTGINVWIELFLLDVEDLD